MKRIIVGITGASGAVYGIRLLEVLHDVDDVEVHLVISDAGARTITLETERSATDVSGLADRVYRNSDIAAAIASGSFQVDGMAVVPCSMKTLSGIANSYADGLIARAADVTLKERRPLIVVPRETPMHLGHLRLLVTVAELGAVVAPPMPAFYHRPATIAELVDHTVGRVVDLLGIESAINVAPRWTGPPTAG